MSTKANEKGERDINLLFLKRGNSKDNYPKEIRQSIFKIMKKDRNQLFN